MKNQKIPKEIWMLALCIALLPPIWAVLSPHIGVSTGAVALICAGIYSTNGNKAKDAVRIALGFLLGDFWAVAAIYLMAGLPLPMECSTFFVLFVLGGLAVLLDYVFEKWLFLPAHLCGWAIGLTIMAPIGAGKLGSLPLEIGAAMLAGVFYVGWGVDFVHRRLCR